MHRILFTIFLFFVIVICNAQDTHFTQTLATNVYNNPSLAGSDSSARVTLSYRNQWPKINGSYVSSFTSFYHYIPKWNAYAGFYYLHDNSGKGIIKANQFNAFYSQNIIIKKLLVRPAISIGFIQKTMDWSKLTFGEMIDPRSGFVYQTKEVTGKNNTTVLDIQSGITIYYKRLLAGMSVAHINQSKYKTGITNSNPRFNFQLGYTMLDKGNFALTPYCFFARQGNFDETVAGVNLKIIKRFQIGGGYRISDAILFNAGFISKFISVYYSYDYTVSALTNKTGGAHEISFISAFHKVKTKRKFIKPISVFN